MEKQKIVSFTDLIAWQEGHRLVLEIYNQTKGYPREELFGLTSQMRRAVVSITSNLAEGFSRRNTPEKIQFYKIAQGSITKLQNQLIISKDIKYIAELAFKDAFELSSRVNKIIYGLINKLNTPNTKY